MNYPTKLSQLGKFVEDCKKKYGEYLLGIILTGSAVSDESYREGWSDIDLYIIVKDTYKIESEDWILISFKKLKGEIKARTIKSYYIQRGIIVYTNNVEFLRLVKKIRLPDRRHKYFLLNSMFVAMKLRKCKETNIEKCRQLYHALRYFVRYHSMPYNFPIFDSEIVEGIDNYFYEEKDELKRLVFDLLKVKKSLKCSDNYYQVLEIRTLKFLNRVCFDN